MKSEMKNAMIGAIVALFFATTLFAVQPPNTTVRCRTCIDSALHVRFPSELDGLRMSSRTTYDVGDDYYNIRYDSDESMARVGGRKLDLTVFKPADGKMMADGVDEDLVKLLEAVGDEGEKFAEQSFKKYKRLDMMVEGRLRKKGLKYMWYSNTMKFQDRGKSHMSIMLMFCWRNRVITLSYAEPILSGRVKPCETLPEGFLKIADAIDDMIVKVEAASKVDVYAIADPKLALEALRQKWLGVEDRVSPYDMPDYAERFYELDRAQGWCNEDIEKRAEVFLSVAKEGVSLKIEPPVWYYNCACALARMGKKDEAFEALEQAIAAGFNKPDGINQDKDFDSLKGDSRFAKLTAMAGEIKRGWQAPKENARIENGSIWLNDTNIYWGFNNASYSVNVTGATSNTLIYLDHNAEHRFPPACDMINVEYTEELDDLGRASGNANFNFLDVEKCRYIPTILGSSAVFKEDRTNYVHSIPARIWGSGFESWNEEWHLYRNVLGVYSIGTDYADDEVDRIFGWNPVSLVYYDKNSEDELARICAEAWRAMKPEVQEAGGIRQLLGIIRRSQKCVKSEADFMSSAAHRPAISTKDIDELKVVELAAKLNKPYPEIPVIEAAKMGFKWTAINDLWTSPYDSPIAHEANHNAVYVARWAERTGRFIVTVQREVDGGELVCRLLQGDPSKVRFKKDKSFEQDGCTYDVMEIECDYHEAFDVQLADGIKMKSTRVDIGCFAVKDGVASVPAIISIFYMPHEKREYGEDGLLKSVDYTKAQIPGWMPQFCPKADFKDVFHWTKDRECTGWTRVSSDGKRTEFTREGLVVMTRDKLGRPQDVRRSRRMEWLQSLVPFVTANEEYSAHMIFQSDGYNRRQDDPRETTLAWKYTYADENDVWGKPSPKELKAFKYKPELCRRANISEESGFKLPLISQMMKGYYRYTKYKFDAFESDAPDWELPDDLFRSDSRYALKERNLKPPVELKKMQFCPWAASSNDLWRIDTASYEKWASEGLYELADGVYRVYRGPSEGNDDGSFASVSETFIAQNIVAESDAYLKLGEKYQRCKTSEIKSLLGDQIDWETTLIAEDKPILEDLPEGVSSVIAMWRVSDNVYVGIRADHNTGFKSRAYFFATAEGGKSNGKIDSFEGLPSRAIGNTVLGAYAGNVEALNNFAVLWYCGIANPKDYDEKAVIDMLKRSSQLGCAAAVYNLGVLYYNRGEKDKAEKFFSEAKKKGYDLK